MIYKQTNKYTLRLGKSEIVLKDYPDNYFHSVVTDPPYELGFMGKGWDKSGIAFNVDFWKEVLRVLKPGGHILAFSGTRTYHRMACAIEDAGFEIRDQIQWLYGQGFPKSMDISKAIDNKLGLEREVVGKREHPTLKNKDLIERSNTQNYGGNETKDEWDITKPNSDQAKEWEGWGTALKPANEPIVLARKPISEKTVAENVLKWGVGGLNIDGSRIEYQSEVDKASATPQGSCTAKSGALAGSLQNESDRTEFERPELKGRWPANLILDEEAAKMLDEQSGILKSGDINPYKRKQENQIKFNVNEGNINSFKGDSGGSSRFFYIAKASTSEKNRGLDSKESQKVNDGRDTPIDNPFQRGETLRKNTHPTVKPVMLMRYLVRMVTPPKGKVLDPFIGSGPTGIACLLEDFEIHGIDMIEEHLSITDGRMTEYKQYEDKKKPLKSLKKTTKGLNKFIK